MIPKRPQPPQRPAAPTKTTLPGIIKPGAKLSPLTASRELSSPAPAKLDFASAVAKEQEERLKEQVLRSSPERIASRRFWLPPGESRMIMILDSTLNEEGVSFARYEHNLQDEETGHYGTYKWCIRDSGKKCPICFKEKKKGALVGFLTILDFQEWTDSKEQVHSYKRTLLPVSGDLATNLLEKERIVTGQGKTLRGMVLTMARGTEKISLRTGMPVDFLAQPTDANTVGWAFLTEEEIQEIANNPEVLREDGSVVKEAGEDLMPYDYRLVFGEPDVEALLEEYGSAVPGSSTDNRRSWDAAKHTSRTTNAPDDADELPGVEETTQFVREDVEYETVEQEPVTQTRPVIPQRPVAAAAVRPVARPVATPATTPARPSIILPTTAPVRPQPVARPGAPKLPVPPTAENAFG